MDAVAVWQRRERWLVNTSMVERSPEIKASEENWSTRFHEVNGVQLL